MLVGVTVAIAAEVAAGILLYAGAGLMRSLNTVLVVEAAAFSAGLWSAPAPGPDLVHRLRRRWLMCLVAFVGAALFGTSWSVVREIGSTAVGQGIGLAVLAALPLYTCGAVLGGMSAVARTDPRGHLHDPGPVAAMGAGIGFAATGFLLPRAPIPSSLLIVCLVLLSLAGMLYGVVLRTRPVVLVMAERSTTAGEVSVEDRRPAGERLRHRVLLEGAYVRRQTRLGGEVVVPWDVVVGRALMPESDSAWRVLLVGGGASAVPRAVLREHPLASVDVLERLAAVVELGREHFDTDLIVGHTDRSSVRIGNLDDLVEELSDSYELIVVDSSALASLGGARGLSRRTRKKLADSVSERGTLVWGPGVDGVTEPVHEWALVSLARPLAAGEEEVLVVTGPGGVPDPQRFEGFESRSGGTPHQQIAEEVQ